MGHLIMEKRHYTLDFLLRVVPDILRIRLTSQTHHWKFVLAAAPVLQVADEGKHERKQYSTAGQHYAAAKRKATMYFLLLNVVLV